MNASRLCVTVAMVMSFMVAAGAWLALEPFKHTAPAQASPSVIYVDTDAPGPTHDGLTWATAYADVQQALTTAISGTEIWVAEGVYYPGAPGNTNATFPLKSGVALYGGFAGTETLRTQRDWAAHVTVLSGDIDHNDFTDPHGIVTSTDNIIGANAYHVVYGSGTDSTATLDGFTVTAGEASGNGGGMYNSHGRPQVTHVIFSGNLASAEGGGMYNGSDSSPTLTNVTFSGNWAFSGGGMGNEQSYPALTNVTFSSNQANSNLANSGGGGMDNFQSNPTLFNVTFHSNQALSGYGGGMINVDGSSPMLTNVTFDSNLAEWGGGMYNLSSSPMLTNVAFNGNQATYGGGMDDDSSNPGLVNVIFSGNWAAYSAGGMSNRNNSSPQLTNVTFSRNQGNHGGMDNSQSNPTLTNCILWDDSPDEIYGSTSIVAYSDVQGGYASAGNLNADPWFVAPITATAAPTTTGNYRLLVGSPAIDAGNTLSVTVSTDLDGYPRVCGVAVDMGAYEYMPYHIYLPIVAKN